MWIWIFANIFPFGLDSSVGFWLLVGIGIGIGIGVDAALLLFPPPAVLLILLAGKYLGNRQKIRRAEIGISGGV